MNIHPNFLALALGALTACSAVPPSPAAPADLRAQVMAAERAFARTMADRDLQAFGSFIAQEAVFFAGNTPLRGRQQVTEDWAKFFAGPQAPFSWEPDLVEVLDSGTLAMSGVGFLYRCRTQPPAPDRETLPSQVLNRLRTDRREPCFEWSPRHGTACPCVHGAASRAGVSMSMSFRQSVSIESAPLQDEVILFHAPSNKFCVLNRTSTFIWSQLKQPATSEEIAMRMGASFSGVTVSEALSDVDSALKEMLALGLIVGEEAGNGQQKEAIR